MSIDDYLLNNKQFKFMLNKNKVEQSKISI